MPPKFGPFACIQVVCNSSSFQRHFDITSTVINTVLPVVHDQREYRTDSRQQPAKQTIPLPRPPIHPIPHLFGPSRISLFTSLSTFTWRLPPPPSPPAGTAITQLSHQTRTRQQPYAPLYYPPQKKKKKKKGTNTLQTVIKSHLRKQTYKPTSKQANKTIRYPKR